MANFNTLEKNELQALGSELSTRYDAFRSRKLQLDITRGKPCSEQLDLSLGMLTCVDADTYKAEDGTDCRNYGGLDGLPEAKALFAEFLEVAPEELIIGGNSSLAMMHDTIVRAILNGVVDSPLPWGKLPKVKFLCPSPGYDRHFFICDYLNIEMIAIEMDENGPDMYTVERLVAEDEAIKGMWCVPKYSNPSGATYSDAVVERLAAMPTKAADFRIFWDNAYTAHHLTDTPDRLKDILAACKKAGHAERVFIFGSTSKLTLAGSGIALMAGSRKNMDRTRKQLAFQTIGPDKLNQLRHVRFFKTMAAIEDHMKKHAAVIKPKFDAVQELLTAGLEGKGIAEWSRPNGGYFVSIDTLDGCAKTIVKMAADAGVKLTPAGATYPYERDPRDRNIRIAPTFPPTDQVKPAMELVGICIQRVSIDKILSG